VQINAAPQPPQVCCAFSTLRIATAAGLLSSLSPIESVRYEDYFNDMVIINS
jgi:hypothetical protein